MKKIIMLLMVCVLILGGCGKKKNTVQSLDDLKNKSIGVQMKTTGDIYVSDIEGAQIKRFNKGLDAVKALRKGVVDAVMIDDAPAKVFAERFDDVEILSEPYAEEEYGIAVNKDERELLGQIDQALQELKDDGKLGKIVKAWLQDGETQTAYETGKKKSGRKELVMVTNAEFPPYESKLDSGDIVGIDVDILAAIAEDQGFEYELKSLGWDAAIAACQSGQADAMIAGASITDERKASGWMFSDGYYDSNQTLTVPEDSDIAGFADLSGKNVAVKTGTQGASYAESLKDEYGFTITYFEDSPTMYQAVLGGQCVGCFEDTPIMKASIKDGALALKVLEDTASDPAPYGFAIFSEDSQELLDMFNKGLADIKANGKYDEILAKYLG